MFSMRFKFIVLISCLFLGNAIHGQIKIGDNPQNINNASVLELESTTKALVVTRVNNLQMDRIFPLQGAVVYNTDTQCLHYYNGTTWINMCDALNTGFTFSTTPIVNNNSTIIITQSGQNYNFEVGDIRGENIVDFSLTGSDLQNNAVTADKLAPDSVGSEELQDNTITDLEIDYSQVTISDFTNDANYLTAANIVSGNPGNDLSLGSDNGAFYNDDNLQTSITNNIQNINNNTNAISLKENTANKSDDIALGTSNTLFPTQNAVKVYVDNQISGSSGTTTNSSLTGTGTTTNPLGIADDGVTTSKILDANVTPEKLAPGLADQILRTDPTGTFVAWGNPPTGGGSSPLFNASTISGSGVAGDAYTVADGGITPIKIAIGAANQILRTDATGTFVSWVDLPAGGGTLIFDPLSIGGTGITGDPYTLADNAVTTSKILDANVTAQKIAVGAANQILRTDATGTFVSWVDLPAGGGTLIFDPLSIGGTGITGDPYTLADNAVTTSKILDANVTAPKIAAGTLGQVLTTTALGTAWADPVMTSPFHALGKLSETTILNGAGIASVNPIGIGNYEVVFSTNASSVNYIIQLTLFGAGAGATIEVIGQQLGSFEVQISDSTGAPIQGSWFFTITDF